MPPGTGLRKKALPEIVRPVRQSKRPGKSPAVPVPKFSNPGIAIYKQGDYRRINEYLRTGEAISGADSDRLKQYIRQIRSGMKAGLDTEFYPALYRGTGYLEFGVRGERFDALKKKEGETVAWKGFTSTSVDRRKAEGFCKGVLIVFLPDPAVRFIDMMPYGNLKHRAEKEILLDTNTRGRIERVKMESSASGLKRYARVDVRLLPPE